MTNGMQYKPEINEGNLNAYDNIIQRNVLYKYDSDEVYAQQNSKVDGKKYVEDIFTNPNQILADSPENTVNVGPAYNLNMLMTKQGCHKCEPTLLSNVKVDGKDYTEVTPQSDVFYNLIEPHSGFLLESKRQLSFFLHLNADKVLPFPDLDNIGEQIIPVFDIQEEL